MQPTIQEELDSILDQVMSDEGLDKELQTDLCDLITAASSDPTPENLEAVSEVFSKLADANRYMEAKTKIQNITLKKDYQDSLNQEVVSTEQASVEVSTPTPTPETPAQ